jgi:hypothetical protein
MISFAGVICEYDEKISKKIETAKKNPCGGGEAWFDR